MIPTFLKEGDTIAIAAPARKVTVQEMSPAVKFLENQGFNVVLGENLFAENNRFAGTDEERAADFQQFFNDDNIRAILCARGGYGSARIIDRLDFTHFLQNPKWICGFSDVTVFHSHLSRFGCASIHSTMAKLIQEDGLENMNNRTLLQALKGQLLAYSFPPHISNRTGSAQGEIVGGNLSLIYAMLASTSEMETDGKILFIEEVGEYLYHIERMMISLKRAGKLTHLAGLIVGDISVKEEPDDIPFGRTAEQIIADCIAEYDYPLCFNFPAGHGENNVALRFGTPAELTVAEFGSTLLIR